MESINPCLKFLLMTRWSTLHFREEDAVAAAAVIYEKSRGTWQWTRAMVVLPAIKVMIWLCLAMSLMLVVEKLSMAVTVLCVKLYRPLRPHRVYRWEPLPAIAGDDDPELGSYVYPAVLVQIPMFNEREDLVQAECERWTKKGVSIHYISRDNRNGYKSGALREAMDFDYVKTCDFVAIFDADHQPPSDFLMQTIPFLIHNPDLALVQARWKFVNADECLMTRIQEMSLNYHFVVEQESGSSTIAFFGFNGTAGVWRISAVDEAKGWKDRTTVEDMDLAVRACLEGWKFVYVGDLNVRSELPSTYKAYRYQQHRWACGPACLFRKMASEIMRAKKASIWRKLFLIYNFFFARRIVSHIVTFFFYCVIIPLSVFFPEVKVPVWGVVLIPSIITFLNAIGTPRCKAVFIGLLEAGRVNEWIVTEKLGNMLQMKQMPSVAASKFWERFHFMEIGVGIWLLICAWQDFKYRTEQYYIFIFPSSLAFIIMGCGYVGR
ncbi:Glucomannan 4-beta-mannosyltransferase 9 [Dendrobium catenatum]|uniref:glucomannan 4-beta-mannosyltransferase n=1 Tax=Dendrobium catenatum TaxID=906689 RepID=A0A2I0VIF3_9ASPA|nr:Glucomannan 4-beta-mannosyltransferase 9 [Dendrobium catenatum]